MTKLNNENWIEINAQGRTLGRLATEISVYLLGKNKPTYSPDKLSNNYVIITNASEIHVTGSKLDKKEIYSHSGFVGGLKRETLGNAIKSNPSKVLRKSVKGMLPKNKLSEIEAKIIKAEELIETKGRLPDGRYGQELLEDAVRQARNEGPQYTRLYKLDELIDPDGNFNFEKSVDWIKTTWKPGSKNRA